MSEARLSLPMARRFGETSRYDLWWVQPLLVFFGFSAFIVYSTWAAFQNDYYTYGPYLSPFYSPLLVADSPEMHHSPDHQKRAAQQFEHSWFGARPNWWPTWLIFSPAFLILWGPGGFRFTCYYYRGAYYKAFWADPPNCAVGEPRKSYWGEHSWPLLLQNVHRYFLYVALGFLVILAWDAIKSFWFDGHIGIGVGSLVLTLNVVFLSCYTLGCHSFRHLVGGYRDQLANAPAQQQVYRCVSCLNRRHMLWAWVSLFWVGFTDVYVRLCSMHLLPDFNTWGIN
jgi:hypothetical protein